jgi:hypothetical protein
LKIIIPATIFSKFFCSQKHDAKVTAFLRYIFCEVKNDVDQSRYSARCSGGWALPKSPDRQNDRFKWNYPDGFFEKLRLILYFIQNKRPIRSCIET